MMHIPKSPNKTKHKSNTTDKKILKSFSEPENHYHTKKHANNPIKRGEMGKMLKKEIP
jgi:hypothetical protein